MMKTNHLVIKKLDTRPTFNWGIFDSDKEEFIEMFNSKKKARAGLKALKNPHPVRTLTKKELAEREIVERLSRKKRLYGGKK